MWTKADMAMAHELSKRALSDPHYAVAYATMRQAEALDELQHRVAQLGWTYGHGSSGAAQFLAQALMSIGDKVGKPLEKVATELHDIEWNTREAG